MTRGVALILGAILVGPSVLGWSISRELDLRGPSGSPTVGSTGSSRADSTILAEAVRDFDEDGQGDTLAVVMVRGRRYDDTSVWCGRGEKYEGEFVVTVRSAGGAATAFPLDDYEFFRAGEWDIVFADYDHDGRLDFNLGQYGGCNGWRYELFTVDSAGRVRPLPTTRRLPVADFSNSTAGFVPVEGGFEHCYYSQVVGHVVERHRWDEDERTFVRIGERRVERCGTWSRERG